MLNEQIKDLINNQINKEMYSAYLYLNISNYYAEKGLNGFSSWFKAQANEELEHAMKFIDYLHGENESVCLEPIEAPKHEFKDFKEPLVLQLNHEKYVTSLINNIYRVTLEVHDYRTTNFLNWFINEQTEEERNSQDLLTQFELFAVDSKSVYQLDQKLSERK